MNTYSTIIRAASALLFGVFTAQANIGVYVSAPGAQKAGESFSAEETVGVDFLREGFEPTAGVDFAFGATAKNGGVYDKTPNGDNYLYNWIRNASPYGGTFNGSTPEEGANERYITADPQGQVITITFGQSVNYFGFFWSAGSGGNRITLYNDANVALGSFNTDDLVTLLPNDPFSKVTAVNGAEYNTIDFYTQPGTGADIEQAFAFLHFINTDGNPYSSIKKVVLEQVTDGGGFESDNHTVSFIAPIVSGSNPNIILVTEQIPEPVPEPSSMLLLGGAGVAAWYLHRRKRSRA